jgi:hypothetical protein
MKKMGILSALLIYKVAKRRTTKRVTRSLSVQQPRTRGMLVHADGTADECLNYQLFCKNYGSCDGQVCEYD